MADKYTFDNMQAFKAAVPESWRNAYGIKGSLAKYNALVNWLTGEKTLSADMLRNFRNVGIVAGNSPANAYLTEKGVEAINDPDVPLPASLVNQRLGDQADKPAEEPQAPTKPAASKTKPSSPQSPIGQNQLAVNNDELEKEINGIINSPSAYGFFRSLYNNFDDIVGGRDAIIDASTAGVTTDIVRNDLRNALELLNESNPNKASLRQILKKPYFARYIAQTTGNDNIFRDKPDDSPAGAFTPDPPAEQSAFIPDTPDTPATPTNSLTEQFAARIAGMMALVNSGALDPVEAVEREIKIMGEAKDAGVNEDDINELINNPDFDPTAVQLPARAEDQGLTTARNEPATREELDELFDDGPQGAFVPDTPAEQPAGAFVPDTPAEEPADIPLTSVVRNLSPKMREALGGLARGDVGWTKQTFNALEKRGLVDSDGRLSERGLDALQVMEIRVDKNAIISKDVTSEQIKQNREVRREARRQQKLDDQLDEYEPRNSWSLPDGEGPFVADEPEQQTEQQKIATVVDRMSRERVVATPGGEVRGVLTETGEIPEAPLTYDAKTIAAKRANEAKKGNNISLDEAEQMLLDDAVAKAGTDIKFIPSPEAVIRRAIANNQTAEEAAAELELEMLRKANERGAAANIPEGDGIPRGKTSDYPDNPEGAPLWVSMALEDQAKREAELEKKREAATRGGRRGGRAGTREEQALLAEGFGESEAMPTLVGSMAGRYGPRDTTMDLPETESGNLDTRRVGEYIRGLETKLMLGQISQQQFDAAMVELRKREGESIAPRQLPRTFKSGPGEIASPEERSYSYPADTIEGQILRSSKADIEAFIPQARQMVASGKMDEGIFDVIGEALALRAGEQREQLDFLFMRGMYGADEYEFLVNKLNEETLAATGAEPGFPQSDRLAQFYMQRGGPEEQPVASLGAALTDRYAQQVNVPAGYPQRPVSATPVSSTGAPLIGGVAPRGTPPIQTGVPRITSLDVPPPGLIIGESSAYPQEPQEPQPQIPTVSLAPGSAVGPGGVILPPMVDNQPPAPLQVVREDRRGFPLPIAQVGGMAAALAGNVFNRFRDTPLPDEGILPRPVSATPTVAGSPQVNRPVYGPPRPPLELVAETPSSARARLAQEALDQALKARVEAARVPVGPSGEPIPMGAGAARPTPAAAGAPFVPDAPRTAGGLVSPAEQAVAAGAAGEPMAGTRFGGGTPDIGPRTPSPYSLNNPAGAPQPPLGGRAVFPGGQSTYIGGLEYGPGRTQYNQILRAQGQPLELTARSVLDDPFLGRFDDIGGGRGVPPGGGGVPPGGGGGGGFGGGNVPPSGGNVPPSGGGGLGPMYGPGRAQYEAIVNRPTFADRLLRGGRTAAQLRETRFGPGVGALKGAGRGLMSAGSFGTGLAGFAAGTVGRRLNRPETIDEEGFDVADVGQGLQGAEPVLAFGGPATAAAIGAGLVTGPVGWGLLAAGTLGAALYGATRGKKTPTQKLDAVASTLGVDSEITSRYRNVLDAMRESGSSDEEVAAQADLFRQQMIQDYQMQEQAASTPTMSPEQQMALQKEYARRIAEINAESNRYTDLAYQQLGLDPNAGITPYVGTSNEALARQLSATRAAAANYGGALAQQAYTTPFADYYKYLQEQQMANAGTYGSSLSAQTDVLNQLGGMQTMAGV